MNEKKIEAAENSLMVVEPEISFEDIGHIEFDGLSKLKSSLFGGYNKESVLDNIDKIIEQSETQLAEMKRYAKIQESRNALLHRQNDELREELYRLVSQLKEEQEDFVIRFSTKEEQIELLQLENRQLREKIERDKRILIERTKLQVGMLKDTSTPTETMPERPEPKPKTLELKPEVKPEPKPIYNTVSELLNSGALNKESLERPKPKASAAAPAQKSAPTDSKVYELPTIPKIEPLSGGDKNWDLDSILEEYGD